MRHCSFLHYVHSHQSNRPAAPSHHARTPSHHARPRMNSKLCEQGKEAEPKRWRGFVEAVLRIEPGVAAHRQEGRLERERQKAEQQQAKRQQREEEERRKAEEEAKGCVVGSR